MVQEKPPPTETFTTKLATITIDIFPNGSTLSAAVIPPNKALTFNEVIGTLETNKINLIFRQKEINKKNAIKYQSKQKKLAKSK